MLRRAVLTWVAFVPVAVLNGIIRQAVYEPALGDLRAHQVSVVTGSAAIFAVAYTMLRHYVAREDDRRLLGIGAGWMAATVLFEFGLGRLVVGDPWTILLRDYNITEGRVWPVVLLTILVSPLLVKRLVAHQPRARAAVTRE